MLPDIVLRSFLGFLCGNLILQGTWNYVIYYSVLNLRNLLQEASVGISAERIPFCVLGASRTVQIFLPVSASLYDVSV